MKSLSKEEFDQLSPIEKAGYALEWKCTCNECGNVWHYLGNVEINLRMKKVGNACDNTSNAANPCTTFGSTQSEIRNTDVNLDSQLRELKQCSKCRSANVTREERFIKKQS